MIIDIIDIDIDIIDIDNFNQEKALVGAFSVITNLWMQFGCNFLRHYNTVPFVAAPAADVRRGGWRAEGERAEAVAGLPGPVPGGEPVRGHLPPHHRGLLHPGLSHAARGHGVQDHRLPVSPHNISRKVRMSSSFCVALLLLAHIQWRAQ